MLTNVVRNFGAVVIDGTCLTGISPTGGQQDDTAMEDYDYEENTYTAPAPAPASLAPSQPSRHRERETREREREREEPRRSDKHRRR